MLACNDAPQAPTITISPERPLTTDTLTLVTVTPAIDDDDVGLTVQWTRNGVEVPTVSGAVSVAPSFTQKDDVWEVTVVASDGRKDSEPVRSSVTIGNSAPTVEVHMVTDPGSTSSPRSVAWALAGATPTETRRGT
jgi:hypothetical protein